MRQQELQKHRESSTGRLKGVELPFSHKSGHQNSDTNFGARVHPQKNRPQGYFDGVGRIILAYVALASLAVGRRQYRMFRPDNAGYHRLLRLINGINFEQPLCFLM